MKHIYYILAFLLHITFFIGCTETSTEISNSSLNKILQATAEDIQSDSRVGFDRHMKFYWSKQDKIGINTDKTPDMFSSMKIITGGGTPNATFKGTISGNIGNYATYPFSYYHYMENSTLHMDMPATYNYTKVDSDFFLEDQGSGNSFNTPMWSAISGGHINMKHLGGVFCIKLLEMPVGENLKLVLSAGKQKISGDFTADLTQATPIIETTNASGNTESEISITFSNKLTKTPGVFYFPVPVGTYQLMYIHVVNGNESTDCALGRNIVVKRGTLKKYELKDGIIDSGEDASIIESSKELIFDANAHEFEIKIKTGIQFTVQEPQVNWIHRIESSETNSIKFRLDANGEYNSRTALIKIKNTSNNQEETVSVTQAQKDVLVISQNKYSINENGGQIAVKIGHNIPFDISIKDNWVKRVTTRNYIEETIYFKVEPNTTSDVRSTKIVFTSKDKSIQQEIEITQTNGKILIVTPNEFKFNAESHNFEIKVETNLQYTVEVNAFWIHPINSKGLTTHTLKYTLDTNSGKQARNASIIIKSKETNHESIVSITQEGKSSSIDDWEPGNTDWF